MRKKKMTARGSKELGREVSAIVKKVEAFRRIKDAPAYKKLDVLEDLFDLYGVAFTIELRNDIIAKAALARFLLAVARYFDVPPETIIQVKRAGW